EFSTYELEILSEENILPKGTECNVGNEPGKKAWKGEDREIRTKMIISSDILSQWTGMSKRQIEMAFWSINFTDTYNLMKFLPRIITINKKEAKIWGTIGEKVEKGLWL